MKVLATKHSHRDAPKEDMMNKFILKATSLVANEDVVNNNSSVITDND